MWLSVAGRGRLVGNSSAKQDQGVCEQQQVVRESAASACGWGGEGGSAGPAVPPLCPAHGRVLVGAVFLQGFPE